MKKIFSIVTAISFAVLGLAVLSACDKNEVTGLSLTFSQENIEFNQESSTDKTINYALMMRYGTEIDLSGFKLWSQIDNSDSVEVSEKTGEAAGYVLESDLPTTELATVGTYTMTFSYEGWKNVVNVTVEKQLVAVPDFEGEWAGESEVKYDGRDFVARISYDKNLVEMVEPFEAIEAKEGEYEERYYFVEFALKDKVNYAWNYTKGYEQYPSDNYIFNFAIYE